MPPRTRADATRAAAAAGPRPSAAAERPEGSATRPNVGSATAFTAGWAMAQLYRPLSTREVRGEVTEHLPTVSELSNAGQVALAVDQLEGYLAGLPVSGVSVASVRRFSPEGVEAFQKALRHLHRNLLTELATPPARLLAGNQLGRPRLLAGWGARQYRHRRVPSGW